MTKTTQNITLVEGTFTSIEAIDVLNALIDTKINFHKLQRLSLCEGDQYADTLYPDHRVNELAKERKIAEEFISNTKKHGYRFKIHGTLDISLVVDK